MPLGHHSKSWRITNGGVKKMPNQELQPPPPETIKQEIKESFQPKREMKEVKKKSKFQK